MNEADLPAAGAATTPLWTFALDLHAKPGVGEACLGLQDRHGCDVNILLFAAWMGAIRRHTLSSAELVEAADAVRDWHAEIVRPLRSVRRRLKSGPPPAPDAATEALRTRLKAIEIDAERIELAALESRGLRWHARDADECGDRISANLALSVRHFAGREPLSEEALQLIRTIGDAATAMPGSR
jgi:uncharacterized protein (TIGR02444 family)